MGDSRSRLRRFRAALLATGLLVVVAVTVPTPAQAAAVTFKSNFKVAAKLSVALSADSWCDNKGPHITLHPTLGLDEHQALLTFKNNVKGTHTYQVLGDVALSLIGTTNGNGDLQTPKQPPLGGVGGNPHIYLQVDNDPTNLHYIGRCVQDGKIGNGLNGGPFENEFDLSAFSALTIASTTCTNRGSSLSVGSDTTTGATTGHLILTNTWAGNNPQHINDDIEASVGFTLANGVNVKKGWDKANQIHGPGGNPLIDGDTGSGAAISTTGVVDTTGFISDGAPVSLGRCKKLLA